MRKNNNISMKDAKVPVEINDLSKYHSKCYRKFTALPQKYRSSSLSKTSLHESSSHDDTESNDNNITVAEINAPGTSRDDNVRASTSSQADTNKIFSPKVTSDTHKEAPDSHEIVGEEIVESRTDDTTDYEDFNKKIMKCIICDKQRKNFHNKEQPLQTCVRQETISLLKSQANEMGDADLVNKINNKCANNAKIFLS
ncbi:hypothetical protein PV327_008165 [Microctonus hyperodae]|uniref:Uncharacterized protein n=1 Tax=Microctonus hyperodae TaxID=165561 RepID=A0AA39F2I9_MICHY|nr:hypothetical protein PV327_008165 [Microctonus hyperodae]